MEEEENLDEQLEELEKQIASFDDTNKSYGYPKAPDKDSVFKFFKNILELKDSSKVGNLDSSELGDLKLTVRGYQDIAHYAAAEKLNVISDYMRGKGEIVLATSTSKKALLLQLFVTQIKKEQKIGIAQPVKSNWWSKKQKEEDNNG